MLVFLLVTGCENGNQEAGKNEAEIAKEKHLKEEKAANEARKNRPKIDGEWKGLNGN